MLDQLCFHQIRSLHPSAPGIVDIESALRTALAGLSTECDKLRAGSRVAVTCGSRGIDRMAAVVRETCVFLRERGLKPFVVPAMGSHGGATAEGQLAVLAEYGITETNIGAPIIATMETIHLGRTPDGIDVYMDRAAWEAGHFIALNRVKMHTDFDGAVESGLMKIVAVGLGKVDGATCFHQNSLRAGYVNAILSMGRHILASGRVLGGIGLVENDRHTICEIGAAPAAEMESLDRRLLVRARQLHGRLPFSELDLLIVDEIGKNVSGGGMDTKVIGRPVHPDRQFTEPLIHIRRIYIRDLTPETAGNAVGMGLADAMHERIGAKANLQVTYTNARTALAYIVAAMPMMFPNDRQAIEFLWKNMGSPSAGQVRAAWIRNTLALHSFAVTPACLTELAANPRYEVLGSHPLEFDPSDNLQPLSALVGSDFYCAAGQQ